MTAPARLDVFAPITKRERDPETGHLYVYGKITGPDLDRDQQRMDPTWLKTAVPDWFRTGNIREMHQSKAVGKALELEEKNDGWYIGAKIVDRDAIEKIEEEVLTGFSIGIKGPRLDFSNKSEAPNGIVNGGHICETSVVDSPCLPTAVLTMAKADSADELQAVNDPQLVENTNEAEDPADANTPAQTSEPDAVKADDYSAEEKRQALRQGQAMENAEGEPSYPIKSKADLRRAIRAVGRGGADHDKIRAHIIARARALGLTSMIPDNWAADGSLQKEAPVGKADAADVEKAEAILAELRALLPDLNKADDGDEDESEDIDGATAAIAAIAALIISEAQSLAEGNLNESCDIALLLQSVEALKWFKCREEAEDDGPDDDDGDAVKAEAPNVEKASAKNGGKLAPPFGKKKPATHAEEDVADDQDDDDEDEEKPAKKKAAATKSDETSDAPVASGMLTKADVAEMLKSARAETEAVFEERIAAVEATNKALEADLVKANGELEAIKAQPMPGGPVLTRTTAQESEARKADAAALRADADALLAKADKYASNPTLANGYRERANVLLAKADA